MRKDNSFLFINTFDPVVPIFNDLAKSLSIKGYTCFALVSSCSYRPSVASQYINYIQVPSFGFKNKRICSIIYFMLAPIFIFIYRKYSVIYFSQPPLFYIFGGLLSKLCGSTFFIHVMDLYPDLLINKFKTNLVLKILKKLSVYVFNSSKGVIVIGDCMKDKLLSRGVFSNLLIKIPNWPNMSLLSHCVSKNNFSDRYKLNNKFVITYTGNMGYFHEFGSIINAAKFLSDNLDILFVFVGSGVSRKYISNHTSSLNNVLLLDFLPFDQLIDLYKITSLHFVSLKEGYEGLMVPSKFYGLIASGKPILYQGNSCSEISNIINNSSCGTVYDSNTSHLHEIITQYYNSPVLCNTHGANAYNCFLNNYHPSMLINRYTSFLINS
ncbi:glycosyltransferase family 4 protein [Alphaproteobacteria bacterium LSUCC0684]